MLPLLALVIGQAATKSKPKPPPPKPPTYETPAAKEVVRMGIAAYDKLKHVGYDVTDGAEMRRIWMSGKGLREQGPFVTWVFDGSKLAVIDNRSKTFYSGKTTRGQITINLAKIGARMDPTLRYTLRKVNPVRRAVLPGSKIRVAGIITLNGKRCRLVEIKRNDLMVLLLIRPDGLLAETTTEIPVKGADDRKFKREFRYFAVGTALERATFSIARPKGYASKPLSALPRPKTAPSESSPSRAAGGA